MAISDKGVALITGASTGIGAVYADRLAKRGYDLILVARNEERLSALATRLKTQTGCSVTTVAADLTDKQALMKVESILRTNSDITMLVNNAGVGSVSTLVDSDIQELEEMIFLNITALTRLTHAVAPEFVARGNGTIVNIASVVGVATEVINGVYGATKSFVLGLGHSLQHELADKGVRIQTVLPTATATEFWDVAGYQAAKVDPMTMSAHDLVDASLVGLDNGELVTIPSLQDNDDWLKFEEGRKALTAKFWSAKPGPRYNITS